MKTRKEYMAGKITHDEYYSQFVGDEVIHLVKRGIGEENIKNSIDPHFNDIPLRRWDRLSSALRLQAGKAVGMANGTGGVSLSDMVCVAKAAARMIKKEI